MSRAASRRAWVLVLPLLLTGLVALVPLLRANEARQQAAWEAACVASGGAVSTASAPQDNPLVVQLRRPTYECRSAVGAVVSVRD